MALVYSKFQLLSRVRPILQIWTTLRVCLRLPKFKNLSSCFLKTQTTLRTFKKLSDADLDSSLILLVNE